MQLTKARFRNGKMRSCLGQWRIQDFCEGDAAGVWPPFFSEGMTPTFYGRLLARIGVARIFRGWVRPGVDPGFLFGGTMEGPKALNEAR